MASKPWPPFRGSGTLGLRAPVKANRSPDLPSEEFAKTTSALATRDEEQIEQWHQMTVSTSALYLASSRRKFIDFLCSSPLLLHFSVEAKMLITRKE